MDSSENKPQNHPFLPFGDEGIPSTIGKNMENIEEETEPLSLQTEEIRKGIIWTAILNPKFKE